MEAGIAAHTERRLHRLEKIIAIFALCAVLALTLGFAQAAPKKGKKGAAEDPLDRMQREHPDQVFLRSNAVIVQDARTGAVMFEKNAGAALPIASITKLMTAMVVLDRGLDLDQRVVISEDDLDTLKHTRSRLKPGSVMLRGELLLLALMASENRAAHALGRAYPGGTDAFVQAMNAKAKLLAMNETHFADPTGLSSQNVASPRDLVKLVRAAHDNYPVIREYSTRDKATVTVQGRELQFQNTNALVRGGTWTIGLSKTGFINEAGRCLVMRASVAGNDLILVLLDSWGKYSRIGDANRIRKWLEAHANRRAAS
jgi:D-alanyl-D-alanine endopeptidase (penicillin-binding protein 7)